MFIWGDREKANIWYAVAEQQLPLYQTLEPGI